MAGNYQNTSFLLFFRVFLGLSFVAVYLNPVAAQDNAQRVYMYLNYFQTDEDQYLVAELKYRADNVFMQLAGIQVDFYLETDSSNFKLGNDVTTEEGIARLDLNELSINTKDSSGFSNYLALFDGNDEYKKARKSLSIKEIELTMETETIDSIYRLSIAGKEKQIGEMTSIEDAEVEILVKRLYSDLPITTGELEDGEFIYEFPNDIPGDAFGDLLVSARITEHDEYGTVETKQKLRWGEPVSFKLEKKPRALWSRAPLWMIFAVWAAFLLVWYNYFLSISKLFGMKKL